MTDISEMLKLQDDELLSKGEAYFLRFTQNYSGRRKELSMYFKMLEVFCATGEIAGRGVAWPEDEPWREYDDPMQQYLARLMADPEVKVRVLSSRLCSKVFFTTVGRFIVDCMHHQAFLSQTMRVEARKMKEVEDLSQHDHSSWQKLIADIGEKHKDDGFDGEFHKRMFSQQITQEKRDKLIDDWGKSIAEHLRQQEQKHLAGLGSNMKQNLNRMFDNVNKTLRGEGVSDEQAVQAWKMMDGRWSESEFVRRLTIVRQQNRYPQLHEVVMKMGRVADNGGRDRLAVVAGGAMKISHSSGSDIEGITIGNDIGSLLPIELATYADKDMENLFYYRYTRHRLQTFDYKSHISKPSRRLSFQTAQRLGPMIVCVDTSASMYGPPQRIIQSMLSLIEETAERLCRDCYLIDFSVGVKAIDLKLRMKQQLYTSVGLKEKEINFHKGHIPFIGGGTDARGMMNATFDMLDNDGAGYMNADVLWISDFLMPLAKPDMLARMKDYRRTGTRFYGLCIRPKGDTANEWTPWFNHIYPVTYQVLKRY